MKRIGARLLAAAAAMLLLLAANTLAGPPPQTSSPQLREARLSHLLGMTVEDPNAQQLGTVKDFVLDAASGRIEYTIIGSGGVLGMGARSQALPASKLSAATIVRGILSAGITRQQWRRYAQFQGNPATLAVTAPSHPEPTGRATSQPRRLELTSKLLGATVVNRNHQNLGTISDLFLDLGRQKPALVIIRTTKFLHRSASFAVPLARLTPLRGDQFAIDASLQLLKQAPLLTEQDWSAAATEGGTTIYRVSVSTET